MFLTDHFTTQEFERSTYALRHGIDNKMPNKYIFAATTLCELVLEPLRLEINKPIVLSSGYRCPELNKAIGGVENSQHMLGQAVDFTTNDMDELQHWFNYIKRNLDFDQLIKERANKNSKTWWIHVSCKTDFSKNRHAVFELIKN